MTDKDREVFAFEMTMLAEVFGEQLSEARLAIYFADLAIYDCGHVVDGIRLARKTKRFFPRIADLAECIDEAVEARVQAFIAGQKRIYAMPAAPRMSELMRAGEIRSLPPSQEGEESTT